MGVKSMPHSMWGDHNGNWVKEKGKIHQTALDRAGSEAVVGSFEIQKGTPPRRREHRVSIQAMGNGKKTRRTGRGPCVKFLEPNSLGVVMFVRPEPDGRKKEKSNSVFAANSKDWHWEKECKVLNNNQQSTSKGSEAGEGDLSGA